MTGSFEEKREISSEAWTAKLALVLSDSSNFAKLNVRKAVRELKRLADSGLISSLTFDQLVKILPNLVSISKSYLEALKEFSRSEGLAQKQASSTIEATMGTLSDELTIIFENMDSDEARLEALRIIADDREKTRRSNERIYQSGARFRNRLGGAAVGAFAVVAALMLNSRKA